VTAHGAPLDPEVVVYLDAIAEPRRTTVVAVHDAIRAALPELPVRLWGRIIGYGAYHYRYATGREGDWFPVGLANNKAYVSLYVVGVEDGRYLAEANQERLGKVSVGRSCIRFKRLEDLDLDVAVELSRRSVQLLGDGGGPPG
jgi:hypothetical protein